MRMPSILRVFAVGLALAWANAHAAPCSGFSDVDDTDMICPGVEWLKNRAITLGCAPGQYCPNDTVTRSQIALFFKRLVAASGAPTLMDATGKVVGAYLGGGQVHVGTPHGPVFVLPQVEGSDTRVWTWLAGEGTVIYLTTDCTGDPYVTNFEGIGRSVVVLRDGPDANVFRVLPGVVPIPVAPNMTSSFSRDGSCQTNLFVTGSAANPVEKLQDLSAEFTPPFTLQ